MDAKIKLDEVEYPLVQADDMTMREQREFEKIAGCGVDRLMKLSEDYRAGLVVAWMAVSIKREKPQLPMEQIVERLDQLKNAELAEAWQSIADQAAQSPPEQPPMKNGSSGSDARLSIVSGDDSEQGPDSGNQADTGSPRSELSSAVNPETSKT